MSKPKFNWITVLKRAIKEPPNIVQQDRLEIRSGYWTTCACGQLCKRLPRKPDSDGEPVDSELARLGRSFYLRIRRQKWPAALEIVHKIEARSAKLLMKQRRAK